MTVIEQTTAVFKRDFRIQISYPFQFISQGAGILFSLFALFFLGRLGGASSFLDQYNGEYFAFALVGVVVLLLAGAALRSFTNGLRSEGGGGTLEILKDVSFELRRGEILGVSGLMGAGRTELATTLFGAPPGAVSGRVEVLGKEAGFRGPHDALAEGIALLTEDRKESGLLFNLTIQKNVTPPRIMNTPYTSSTIGPVTPHLRRHYRILVDLAAVSRPLWPR